MDCVCVLDAKDDTNYPMSVCPQILQYCKGGGLVVNCIPLFPL